MSLEKQDLDLVFDSIQKQLNLLHTSLSKEIHGGLKGVRMYVDSNAEITQTKLDSIIEINKHQNNSLSEHGEQLKEHDEKIKEFQPYIRFFRGMWKHWYLTLLGLFVLGFVGAVIYNNVSIKKSIEKKGIVISKID